MTSRSHSPARVSLGISLPVLVRSQSEDPRIHLKASWWDHLLRAANDTEESAEASFDGFLLCSHQVGDMFSSQNTGSCSGGWRATRSSFTLVGVNVPAQSLSPTEKTA